MSNFDPSTGSQDTIGTTLPSVTASTSPTGNVGRAETITQIEVVLEQIESVVTGMYQQLQTLASTVATQGQQIIALGGSSNPVPLNTALPAISNANPVVGQSTSVSAGSWQFGPTNFGYQWLSGGSDAPGSGATTNTYVPVTADVGQALSVIVTASNGTGSSQAVSASTAPVSATTTSKPSNVTVPVITGTPTVGNSLSTSNGTWAGTTPLTFSYQWKIGGGNATGPGATSGTYTAVTADIGNTLTVQVTATNTLGFASATSAPTVAVTQTASTTPPVISVLPFITDTTSGSSTISVGDVLTVSNGVWAGSTNTVQPVQAAVTNGATAGTTLNLTFGTASTSGNTLLIMACAYKTTITAPSGWTQIQAYTSIAGGSNNLYVFGKAAASASTTVALPITIASGGNVYACLSEWPSSIPITLDSVTPAATGATGAGGSQTLTATGAPGGAGNLVLAFGTWGSATSATTPAGWQFLANTIDATGAEFYYYTTTTTAAPTITFHSNVIINGTAIDMAVFT